MTDSVFITNTELSVSETAGTVFESISRSGSLAGPVTVTYGITGDTATAGLDFVGGTGTITIPAGVSRVTVPIQIINDNLPEPTEDFVFSLITSPDAAIAAPRTSRISILDDETPAPPPNPEPPLTSNYNVTPVALATGVNQPVRFVFSPLNPSQVYVAGKSGVIALSDLTTGITRTVIDLSGQVNDAQDRGLLDIALDPNFAQNGFIYAFMVVDPAGTAGQTGGAAPDGTGNRYSQVVRYTADPATGFTTIVANSAKILLGAAGQSLADISGGGALDFTDPALSGNTSSDQFINPNAATPPVVINGFKQDYIKVDSRSHAGGHLTFGPDGELYVSVGDGSSFDYADPRAPNVQSLDSLSGKILRIDPATGLGLTDNPFVTSGVSLDSDRAKVYQLGLRNPFSVTFAPDGRLFIADTGWFSWEEIDSGGPGANFGWPFFEGNDSGVSAPTPDYSAMPAAQVFYSSVANGTTFVTAPIRAFSHNSADPGFQNQAITAGEAIYTGSIYPASLQNNFFFTSFTTGQIFAVNINNSADAKFLYSVAGTAPTDFVQGPDGSVYYADPVTGIIGRLDITDASAPVNAPVTLAIGSGPDALVLRISQDAFQGSAQYTVSVDGAQIGGTLTAGASHAAAQDDTITILGTFAPGPHTLTVNFLNDLYGGTSATDRNLYVDGITYNTATVPAGTAPLFAGGPRDFGFTDTGTGIGTPPPPPPPPPGGTTIGSGPDTLVLKISQDAFQGSAQYTVSVDGLAIGATLTATALHGSGQDDTITVLGNFAPGPHVLAVNFLNDLWNGTAATDRNLYVDGVTYNGAAVPASAVALLSAGPKQIAFTDTGTGTSTPPPPPPPPPGSTTIGSGPDTLVLKISQDAFQGSAQYTVSVDGVAIGTTLTATALHGSGQDDTITVLGNFAPGPHVLAVNFLNDLWNGTAATDRNLYVDGVTYNGAAVPASTVALLTAGPKQIAFTDTGTVTPPPPPPPPPGGPTIGSGPDTLVLKISQDAFQGSAQYTISVDGAVIGTTLTATALHGSGQDDTITVLGNFGTAAHTLTVTFLNDFYGGSPAADRNLYVDGVTFKGATVPGATAALLGDGSQSFGFGGGGTAPLIAAALISPATPTVTIDPTDTSPVVNLSNVNIVATAGDHTLFIGGSLDTATLTGGAETVLASLGNNSITTGAAADTIRIAGSGNVVDAGGGTNHIEDNGSGGNTIVMPGLGGFDDVFGAVLQNGDTLDFQTALAATAWDSSNATLGNFLRITTVGTDAIIAMAQTAGSAFTNVATLHGSGTLDLPGLLAHALV